MDLEVVFDVKTDIRRPCAPMFVTEAEELSGMRLAGAEMGIGSRYRFMSASTVLWSLTVCFQT